MRTIYLYEMKRVLCNKLFAAMLLIWLPCCLIIQRCRLYRVIPVNEP